MKILFILDHLKGGGAERIALSLAESLHQQDHEVVIALLDSTEIKMPVPVGIKQINLDFSSSFFTGRLWQSTRKKFLKSDQDKISQLIDTVQPDKVIVSPWRAFYLAQSKILNNNNVFFWIHGEVIDLVRRPQKNVFRTYKEVLRLYKEKYYFSKILNGKNIIIVNSDLKTMYQLILKNSNIQVLSNGVDINTIQKLAGNQIDKKWDCIFVGRLSPEKQPEHAIQAFANSGLKGKMAIVGDGQMRAELVALCKEINIIERVDFLGWQENPYPFIQQSKVLLLTSKSEGFGLVISEALILNTTVLAYNASDGIDYQLNHNDLVQGLVNNQDLDDLTRKLSQVVKQPYPITDDDKNRLSIEQMATHFIDILSQ